SNSGTTSKPATPAANASNNYTQLSVRNYVVTYKQVRWTTTLVRHASPGRLPRRVRERFPIKSSLVEPDEALVVCSAGFSLSKAPRPPKGGTTNPRVARGQPLGKVGPHP